MEQAINFAVTKSLKGAVDKARDQRFRQDHCQSIMKFQNPTQNNIKDMISEKD